MAVRTGAGRRQCARRWAAEPLKRVDSGKSVYPPGSLLYDWQCRSPRLAAPAALLLPHDRKHVDSTAVFQHLHYERWKVGVE
jgi:hypothetical protein